MKHNIYKWVKVYCCTIACTPEKNISSISSASLTLARQQRVNGTRYFLIESLKSHCSPPGRSTIELATSLDLARSLLKFKASN